MKKNDGRQKQSRTAIASALLVGGLALTSGSSRAATAVGTASATVVGSVAVIVTVPAPVPPPCRGRTDPGLVGDRLQGGELHREPLHQRPLAACGGGASRWHRWERRPVGRGDGWWKRSARRHGCPGRRRRRAASGQYRDRQCDAQGRWLPVRQRWLRPDNCRVATGQWCGQHRVQLTRPRRPSRLRLWRFDTASCQTGSRWPCRR